jgi:hypothetical protein
VPINGRQHLETLFGQIFIQELANAGFIIHYQYGFLHFICLSFCFCSNNPVK